MIELTKIQITDKPSDVSDGITLVFKGEKNLPGVSAAEFDGKKLSTLLLRCEGDRQMYVGLGDKPKVTKNILRQAAGTGVKAFLKIGAEQISIDARSFPEHIQAMVEGALRSAYKFETYLEPSAQRKNSLKQLHLLVASRDLKAAREEARVGEVLAQAENYVREIGNQPGNVVTPEALAEHAQQLARTRKLICKIRTKKELRKEGFNAILAVGGGSAHPPRFIVLEYRGGPKNEKPIVLVGKAVTFDSGGISLKPGDRMDEMKFDKMGGTTVLGILRAAADLKIKHNVVGIIVAVENLPGPEAYRPGDVIKTYNGKTIEVLNTDAEGRIILADAMAYACKHYQPRHLIDFATLTGAVVVALGSHKAGLFVTDDKLRDQLVAAGELTGQHVWPMPLGEEYREQIKSDIATVKNLGGKEGGPSTGASFIQTWVGEGISWAHIDIAGTAWSNKELSYQEKGVTAFGLRLIVEGLFRI